MNLGEATAIFKNINQGERTIEEKKLAIKTVLGMDTHNGITKQEFINALDWLMNHTTAYDVDKVVERLSERISSAEEKAAEYDEAGRIDLMDIHDAESRAYRNSVIIVKAGGTNG